MLPTNTTKAEVAQHLGPANNLSELEYSLISHHEGFTKPLLLQKRELNQAVMVWHSRLHGGASTAREGSPIS